VGLIVVVILVLLVLGAFPRSGAYNAEWGYGPSGLLGLIVLVLLVLMLLGHVPYGF
jgi:hypothetical protein